MSRRDDEQDEKKRAPTKRKAKALDALIPQKAIRWKGAKQRNRWLTMWRSAVMRTFDTQARALKVCWAVEGLAAGGGYCFSGNEFLSQQTGIPIKRIDETLTILERAGAIIRTRIATRNGRRRRIYLSAEIIIGNPPKPGGLQRNQQSPQARGDATDASNPPKPGENDPPGPGGIEAKKDGATPCQPGAPRSRGPKTTPAGTDSGARASSVRAPDDGAVS